MYQVVQVLDCVLISASKNQTVYFRDCFDLYKTIHFSRRTRMLVWTLFRNIWHLYWNTGYLPKNNFGIFEKTKNKKKQKKKTKGYGIFGVNYFGNGIPIPPYPTKTNLHDIPCQNTNRQTKYKHPLTIWHGRSESLALQIRCWITTIGLLRQPFAIVIHLCIQMTVVHSNSFPFSPARCKHQHTVSLPPCESDSPFANWWRHVQGR